MDSYLTLSHLRDHEISLELLYDAWIGQKLDLKLTQNFEATRKVFLFYNLHLTHFHPTHFHLALGTISTRGLALVS